MHAWQYKIMYLLMLSSTLHRAMGFLLWLDRSPWCIIWKDIVLALNVKVDKIIGHYGCVCSAQGTFDPIPSKKTPHNVIQWNCFKVLNPESTDRNGTENKCLIYLFEINVLFWKCHTNIYKLVNFSGKYNFRAMSVGDPCWIFWENVFPGYSRIRSAFRQ